MSKPVESSSEIAQVGTCSANQDSSIGDIIAEAMDKVGKDGVITVEEGKSLETEVELVEGMQFDKGYLSPHFVTDTGDDGMHPRGLLRPHPREEDLNAKDLLPILGKVAEAGKSLLIVAEDVEGEALATLVVNKLRGVLKVAAVKAPGFGDRRKSMLQDIAVLTGGQPVMEELGIDLETMDASDLGRAKKITIDKDNTTIIEGAGSTEDITGRIDLIQGPDRTVLRLRRREASGASGQAGRRRRADQRRCGHRGRDEGEEGPRRGCRAAVEEGILPGGGSAVLKARRTLDALRESRQGDEQLGVDIIHRALAAPCPSDRRELRRRRGHRGPKSHRVR